jgi:hypothetical protein
METRTKSSCISSSALGSAQRGANLSLCLISAIGVLMLSSGCEMTPQRHEELTQRIANAQSLVKGVKELTAETVELKRAANDLRTRPQTDR